MGWYAVTDSDWGWDSTDDGDGAPALVEASSPEEAVHLAVSLWMEKEQGAPFDSADLKVAEVSTIGFMGVSIVDGEPVFEKLRPLDQCDLTTAAEAERDRLRAEAAALREVVEGIEFAMGAVLLSYDGAVPPPDVRAKLEAWKAKRKAALDPQP